MRFVTYGVSDIGCVRDENQDSLLLIEPSEGEARECRGQLVVVADGMGGLDGGSVASQLVVETMERCYYSAPGDPEEALRDAAMEANRAVHERSSELAEGSRMGSTLTAAGLLESSVIVAQVGDSRAYHLRGAEVRQVTRDHSLVQELADRADVELSEAAWNMHRNVVTRGIGLLPDVEVDLYAIDDLREGDTVLLSSDGFHALVSEEEIASCVERHGEDLEGSCKEFVALARERGGHDNITVALAQVAGLSSERGAAGEGETLQANTPRGGFLPLALFLSFAFGVLLTLLIEKSPPEDVRVERLRQGVGEALRLLDEDELEKQGVDPVRVCLEKLQEEL